MMNAHIEPLLRILLLIGVAVYLFVILWLMKKQKQKGLLKQEDLGRFTIINKIII